MTIFKCKMCGGALEVKEGQSTVECEYCGTTQTLPKLDNEKINTLYDRANHFRRNNEFDKATSIYEKILNENKEDAEAYWSLVLCRFGIEYVEDPQTHKRVPTVNRTQYTSIFEDENYKSALKYADSVQKDIYEKEAQTINDIQKGILSISQKEEPFDVFICYKETDRDGRRTQDSVLANDIYHQLKQEGLKVFFSRITLEDKLGTAYEPYIFAALNSAKVMVVLGTKPEYFNAVWVKNEWSRYLNIAKESNGKKVLIPAYRDMDPYDLPEEFSFLQAQDMSKLGFMQDLIRGIKKIVGKEEVKPAVEKVVVQQATSGNISALLTRAQFALEDKQWEKADEFYEEVLNQDAQNVEAYLGKLFSYLHVERIEDLEALGTPFDNSTRYRNVLRVADHKLKNQLKSLNENIKERNELNRLTSIYNEATEIMNSAENGKEYGKAALLYAGIVEFKDSSELRTYCIEKANECNRNDSYERGIRRMSQRTISSLENAIEIFEELKDWKDSKEKAEECKKLIEEIKEQEETDRKNEIYEAAEKFLKEAEKDLNSAKVSTDYELVKEEFKQIIAKFKEIEEWKDSKDKVYYCETKIEEVKQKSKELKIIEEETKALEEQQERQRKEQRAKKMKFSIIILLIGLVVIVISFKVIIPNIKEKQEIQQQKDKYSQAAQLVKSGDYTEAVEMYNSLGNYKDSRVLSANIFDHFTKISSTSTDDAFILDTDGKISFVGEDFVGETKVSDWKDTVDVSAGSHNTLALQSDGTVLSTTINRSKYDDGQTKVENWKDIIEIYSGGYHSVGLKKDGTVLAVGSNDNGECNVSDWKNIVSICAGNRFTIGLKNDGTVVSAGLPDIVKSKVEKWKNIVQISAKYYNIMALQSDGTVVSLFYDNQYLSIDDIHSVNYSTDEFENIVQVSAGAYHRVGLKSDGTVVAVGSNGFGQCNVENWEDIVAVYTGFNSTFGVKSDGTILSTGQITIK